MTPAQQAALEGLAGRTLLPAELSGIELLLNPEDRRDDLIAAVLSAGRTEIHSRMTSSRGLAELYPAGPAGAEVVLMKLEGAAAALKTSSDQGEKVLGSLIGRQLGFLNGEGLDFGSGALRGMLDQFVSLGILTADEVAGLKSIAVRAAPVPVDVVSRALNIAEGRMVV